MDRNPAAALIVSVLRALTAFLLVACAAQVHGQAALTQGTNFGVDIAADGRLAIDLLGTLWTLPPNGGVATPITEANAAARRPRWAPDASAIVYQRRAESLNQLWLFRARDGSITNISDGEFFDQHPDWHPDGERIIYSSDRRDSGFDLWELDLETRLTWRISDLPGDETEPAWSGDGRDLVFIHYKDGIWSLVLRRHGQPDRVLEDSIVRLSAPSWRPDGSLITFIRHSDDGLTMDMAILAEPLLVRPLITGEDLFLSPVAWRNRQQMVYTGNGVIRTRHFNSWTSRTLPMRAMVRRAKTRAKSAPPVRRLPPVEAPTTTLVVRTARLFDGVASGYREGLDIVIDRGTITAVEERRDWPGAIVIDMGNLTTLPGYIDGYAALPTDAAESLGPVLLSFGITTLVAEHGDAEELNAVWAGKTMPGPRVLSADWKPDLELLTSMVPGTESQPVSPAGIRYENVQIMDAEEPAMLLSGLADARTRGLSNLLRSRQARLLGQLPVATRRFAEKPRLNEQAPAIVMGSKPNGLPVGVGLHAEFRALSEAGLPADKVLRTAGINVASALGLGLQIGRIAPGASADLVIVDGDPLANVDDAQNIVGVVRNGRFYSAIGLIERVEPAGTVE